jgi:type IX secretion system PorP/SprF family membrane protein
MKKVSLILIAVLFAEFSFGQQVPFYPVSYRIFSPLIINPAYAGSKDFISADIIAGFQGETYSQLLSGNTRISKKVPGYILSSKSSEFTNIGIGGSAFNMMNDTSQLSGAGAAFSYHIPVNKESLTFLSIGVSAKGAYYLYKGDEDLSRPSKEFILPNADFGLYLYNPSFFAGLSATNLLGRNDTLTKYWVPVSRQYNFQGGVKIVVSRSLRLVIEPSVIITTDDSLSFDIKKNIEPMLKVYAGNFCIGTYYARTNFNSSSKISFFFQYKFPRLYLGAFFALPNDAYFKKSPTTEIAVGFNFSRNKPGFTQNSHW